MRPIDFPEANVHFSKPLTMADEECLPVSAYHGVNEGGHDFINTLWMPSKEDIDAINAGRPIVVTILGSNLPPLSLFTCDEKDEPNF